MTRKEYSENVLAQLRRLTPEEKQDVLAELDTHMEDRICALLELGYDEALAEERVMVLGPLHIGGWFISVPA